VEPVLSPEPELLDPAVVAFEPEADDEDALEPSETSGVSTADGAGTGVVIGLAAPNADCTPPVPAAAMLDDEVPPAAELGPAGPFACAPAPDPAEEAAADVAARVAAVLKLSAWFVAPESPV
jgi:hypothetical protein